MTSCCASCVAGKMGGGSKFAPVVFVALRLSENYTDVTLKVL